MEELLIRGWGLIFRGVALAATTPANQRSASGVEFPHRA